MYDFIPSNTMILPVGIDLGTTNCCVGVWRNDEPRIIEDRQGKRTIPSWVAMTENQILVGETAKAQVKSNPNRTFYDIKRIIGLSYEDAKHDIDDLTFPVSVDNGHLKVELGSTEEVSAQLLQRIKENIQQKYPNGDIKAVITVPAYFSSRQRQATRLAAKIADLDVLRIINEPTAASLAYNLHHDNDGKVLIFDCGGGTHDVSLINIKNGYIKVLSTAGDTHLGGKDFDNRIINYCCKEIKTKFNIDIRNNHMFFHMLKDKVEMAKCYLSDSLSETIECFYGSGTHSITITRQKFQNLCQDLFEQSMDCVTNALEQGKTSRNEINQIVLVGGSTRITKIRELLQEYFPDKTICMSVNPDECVAYGATVLSAQLCEIKSDKLRRFTLHDVTPLGLSIACKDNVASRIIKMNKSIPLTKTRTYATTNDNQESVKITVLEGQSALVSENKVLGEFDMNNLPPARAGEIKIKVSFTINEDGILKVTAEIIASGESKTIHLQNLGEYMEKDIDSMIENARVFKKRDILFRQTNLERNKLEDYLLQCEDDKRQLGEDFLLTNPNANIQDIIQFKEQLQAQQDIFIQEPAMFNNSELENSATSSIDNLYDVNDNVDVNNNPYDVDVNNNPYDVNNNPYDVNVNNNPYDVDVNNNPYDVVVNEDVNDDVNDDVDDDYHNDDDDDDSYDHPYDMNYDHIFTQKTNNFQNEMRAAETNNIDSDTSDDESEKAINNTLDFNTMCINLENNTLTTNEKAYLKQMIIMLMQ
uniref:Hsp70 protein n=1 Tax=Megaviridae environmental sample TaxID=1737588 RepID=A0A5J6VIS5_9VIRU|nr:MAG: Hsp70 protein [Megaviridae environmental sample]